MVVVEKAYEYAKDAVTDGNEPLPDDIKAVAAAERDHLLEPTALFAAT